MRKTLNLKRLTQTQTTEKRIAAIAGYVDYKASGLNPALFRCLPETPSLRTPNRDFGLPRPSSIRTQDRVKTQQAIDKLADDDAYEFVISSCRKTAYLFREILGDAFDIAIAKPASLPPVLILLPRLEKSPLQLSQPDISAFPVGTTTFIPGSLATRLPPILSLLPANILLTIFPPVSLLPPANILSTTLPTSFREERYPLFTRLTNTRKFQFVTALPARTPTTAQIRSAFVPQTINIVQPASIPKMSAFMKTHAEVQAREEKLAENLLKKTRKSGENSI